MPSNKDTCVNTKRPVKRQVQFRLDPEHYATLSEKVQADKSVGDVACALVIDALARESDAARLREVLIRLEGRLAKLDERLTAVETLCSKQRELVLNATQTLLAGAGKLSVEEAAAWKKEKAHLG